MQTDGQKKERKKEKKRKERGRNAMQMQNALEKRRSDGKLTSERAQAGPCNLAALHGTCASEAGETLGVVHG